MKLGNNLDVNKNQLLNALLQIIAGNHGSPQEGLIWYDSVAQTLKFRDGTAIRDLRDFSRTSGTRDHNAISDFDTQVRASRLDQMTAPTGSVAMGGQKITGLADGTASTDAASWGQVQNLINGVDWKASVRAATIAAITLSGTQTIDGVAVIAGDRVLVKDQAAPANNGIYVVAAGAWARATDADSSAEVTPGMAVFVEEGTTNGNQQWVLTTDAPVTLGTTGLVFAQIGATGAAPAAGGGLTLGSNTYAVGAGTGIVVNADDVAVDTSVVARKYISAALGDGAATSFNVDHNLGNQWVTVQVVDASTGEDLMPLITRTTANRVVVAFSTAPTATSFRVIVVG